MTGIPFQAPAPPDRASSDAEVRRRDAALLCLRVTLGVVFLLFGVEKVRVPGAWIVFVPDWLARMLGSATESLLRAQGVVEFSLGLFLLLGFVTRWSAGAAALLMGAIVVNLGLDPIGIRDIGLLGAALALAILGPGTWSADERLVLVAPRRHGRIRIAVVGVAALATLVAGGVFSSRGGETSANALGTYAAETGEVREHVIKPIPRSITLDARTVALGERLFRDPLLSKDKTVACVTCHDLTSGGDDGRRVSVGMGGHEGELNAPTVFNSGLQFAQFWDGRAQTLEEQIDGPLGHDSEMASSWDEVVTRLRADPDYARTFAAIYPDGVNAGNIKNAIAVFERSLLTPDGKFDRWLRGDEAALSSREKEGARLFEEFGCAFCHSGVGVGGSMFQTMGKFARYFDERGRPITAADLGRYNITGDERDRHKFKVPMLRNVELTAPYFHDGSVETLPEAVRLMARYQAGVDPTDEEVALLVDYLKTLTGTRDGRPLAP